MNRWVNWNKIFFARILSVILFLFFLLSSDVFAVIPDLNPAPFRGWQNTTLQAWDFLTNANPAAPEAGWVNPFGSPLSQVISIRKESAWLAEEVGHQGVWILNCFSNIGMVMDIPNKSEGTIWLQTVYASEDNWVPSIWVLKDGNADTAKSMDLIEKRAINDAFSYALYTMTIGPSFKSCSVFIRPRDCKAKIDSVLVETLTSVVGPSPDIDDDGLVHLSDLLRLADQWTRSDCSVSPENNWCSGADITQDGVVNLDDLAILAAFWLTNSL
ncbi:MAG: hypothetical protein GX455_01775 [Phycisphaerae bacterium]|nr:hypothetical protein [Phycisphaerae bacterium]